MYQVQSKEECEASCHSITGKINKRQEESRILRNTFITGESCHWKSGSNSATTGALFSYSSCTTNTSTCNDGECDGLEQMEETLCPQDRVKKGMGTQIRYFLLYFQFQTKLDWGFL